MVDRNLGMLYQAQFRAFLWMLLLWLAAVPVAASESNFVTLILPKGVQIDAPRSWWVLDEEMNTLIQTSAEAVIDIAGLGTSSNGTPLFAANSTPFWTYASVRVELGSEAVTPAEIIALRDADEPDLQDFRDELEQLLRQTLPLQNLTFIAALDIHKEQYSSYPALSFRYLRTGQKGPVVVDAIQIWRQDGIVTVNLAYRESESTLWMPVITRIKRSIVLQ
jgi:hypothetical protein